LVVQRFPDNPQNDADVLLFAVSNQLLDIHLRNDLEQITQLLPTLIENDVLEPVF
jgi:hypothetical protein